MCVVLRVCVCVYTYTSILHLTFRMSALLDVNTWFQAEGFTGVASGLTGAAPKVPGPPANAVEDSNLIPSPNCLPHHSL